MMTENNKIFLITSLKLFCWLKHPAHKYTQGVSHGTMQSSFFTISFSQRNRECITKINQRSGRTMQNRHRDTGHHFAKMVNLKIGKETDIKIMAALCVPLVARRGNSIYHRGDFLCHIIVVFFVMSFLVPQALLWWFSCHVMSLLLQL